MFTVKSDDMISSEILGYFLTVIGIVIVIFEVTSDNFRKIFRDWKIFSLLYNKQIVFSSEISSRTLKRKFMSPHSCMLYIFLVVFNNLSRCKLTPVIAVQIFALSNLFLPVLLMYGVSYLLLAGISRCASCS